MSASGPETYLCPGTSTLLLFDSIVYLTMNESEPAVEVYSAEILSQTRPAKIDVPSEMLKQALWASIVLWHGNLDALIRVILTKNKLDITTISVELTT